MYDSIERILTLALKERNQLAKKMLQMTDNEQEEANEELQTLIALVDYILDL